MKSDQLVSLVNAVTPLKFDPSHESAVLNAAGSLPSYTTDIVIYIYAGTEHSPTFPANKKNVRLQDRPRR